VSMKTSEARWRSIKDRPVFIGGHRKSGTTLLASLLDGHPDLFIYPGETAFFYKFFPVFDREEYSLKRKIDRIVNSCLGDFDLVIRKWIGSDRCPGYSLRKLTGLYRRNVLATPGRSRDFFEAIIHSAWQILGPGMHEARYWVEKTTSIEIYADVLFGWYPNAKFIHLIRDPRDNYGAIKAGWNKRYRFQFDCQERLLQSVLDRGKLGMELAGINLRRFSAKRYLILRMEDVVSKPRETMGKICSFLGIPFRDSLMKPTFLGVPWAGNNFENMSFGQVSKANLNRWKERITEHEAKVLEFYFRDLMQKYRYPRVFDLQEAADAARVHYKWFNYAQVYSLKIPKA